MKTTRIIGAALALLLPTLSAAPAVPRQTGQPKPYLPTARAQRENAYLHLHFLGLMTQFIEEARPPFQANTIMGSMMSRQARLPLDPDLRRFLTLYGLYAQAKGIVEKEAANYFAKSDIAHWVADALSNYREGAITKEGLSAADTLKLADYARRIKEIEARYEPQINEVIARFHTKTGGEYKGFYGNPAFLSRLQKNVIDPPQQTPPQLVYSEYLTGLNAQNSAYEYFGDSSYDRLRRTWVETFPPELLDYGKIFSEVTGYSVKDPRLKLIAMAVECVFEVSGEIAKQRRLEQVRGTKEAVDKVRERVEDEIRYLQGLEDFVDSEIQEMVRRGLFAPDGSRDQRLSAAPQAEWKVRDFSNTLAFMIGDRDNLLKYVQAEGAGLNIALALHQKAAAAEPGPPV